MTPCNLPSPVSGRPCGLEAGHVDTRRTPHRAPRPRTILEDRDAASLARHWSAGFRHGAFDRLATESMADPDAADFLAAGLARFVPPDDDARLNVEAAWTVAEHPDAYRPEVVALAARILATPPVRPRWTLDHGQLRLDGDPLLTLVRAQWGDGAPPEATLDLLAARIVDTLNAAEG